MASCSPWTCVLHKNYSWAGVITGILPPKSDVQQKSTSCKSRAPNEYPRWLSYIHVVMLLLWALCFILALEKKLISSSALFPPHWASGHRALGEVQERRLRNGRRQSEKLAARGAQLSSSGWSVGQWPLRCWLQQPGAVQGVSRHWWPEQANPRRTRAGPSENEPHMLAQARTVNTCATCTWITCNILQWNYSEMPRQAQQEGGRFSAYYLRAWPVLSTGHRRGMVA